MRIKNKRIRKLIVSFNSLCVVLIRNPFLSLLFSGITFVIAAYLDERMSTSFLKGFWLILFNLGCAALIQNNKRLKLWLLIAAYMWTTITVFYWLKNQTLGTVSIGSIVGLIILPSILRYLVEWLKILKELIVIQKLNIKDSKKYLFLLILSIVPDAGTIESLIIILMVTTTCP